MEEVKVYAELSWQAYPDVGGTPEGWNRLDTSAPSGSGFSAVAYQNSATQEVVIVYSGTDSIYPDFVVDDLKIGLDQIPNQYAEAVDYYQNIRNMVGGNVDITLAGHSLGGALASLVGAQYAEYTVAFNAPGVSHLLNDLGLDRPPAEYDWINNYNALFDPVSKLGLQIGNSEFYFVSSFPLVPDWMEPFVAILHPLLAGAYLYGQHKINNLAGSLFTSGQQWFFSADPMTIDLDGDGLEVIANDGTILFDHNGDGVQIGTSWIGPDDGFLARDINGNGLIDDGTELFGDSTLKGDGSNAVDGFDALADLDSNGDGIIDASDAVFSELRIWQDSDSDAVTDVSELKTLASLGIESISLAKSQLDQLLPDGSTIADVGTFTYTDGSTGETYSTGDLGDVDLNVNTFFSNYTTSIPLTPTTELLPEINGSGRVRDLREAASQSGSLESVLTSYTNASTRSEQLALLDSLVSEWAATSDMDDVITRAFHSGYIVNYTFGNLGSNGTDTTQFEGFSVTSDGDDAYSAASSVWSAYTQNTSPEYQEWLNKISILERFNGRAFLNFPEPDTQTELPTFSVSVTPAGGGAAVDFGIYVVNVNIAQQRLGLLQNAYDALLDSVYQGLLLQTRFREFTDNIGLDLDVNGDLVMDFAAMEQVIANRIVADQEIGLIDLIEYNQLVVEDVIQSGWNGWNFLADQLRAATIIPAGQAILDEFGVQFTDAGVTPAGTAGNDILLGDSADNTLSGGDGNDVLSGDAGADTLNGGNGVDTLYGDAGDDYIDSGSGNDILYGGDGNDTLIGNISGSDALYGGDGDDTLYGGAVSAGSNSYYDSADTLHGGTGNDWLEVGGGGDTYIFELGDGIDTIQEQWSYTEPDDILAFGAGIAPTDIVASRDNHDLLLSHVNGTDAVRIKDWFLQSDGDYQVEKVTFADGTDWLSADITAPLLVTTGTAGDDILTGTQGYGDTLIGDAGNDTLNGLNGNDTLYGGDGADSLYGGNDSDVLYGDAGDDYLHSGTGSDTVYGGDGNDTLIGDIFGSDTLYGGDGDDFLYGGTVSGSSNAYYDPADTLHGGKGNDWLAGGGGGDTYIFELGDGNDTIQEQWGYTEPDDVLAFGAGIAPADIVASRDSHDLLLSHVNGTDSVRIKDWFLQSDSVYQVERVTFADGTEWLAADITAPLLVTTGTAGDDILTGTQGYGDTLIGAAGNDTLNGLNGNDTLYGGDGADTLYGGNDSDVLYGDAGDDYLHSGRGNDTVYGGDGNDTLIGDIFGSDTLYGGDGDDLLYGGSVNNSGNYYYDPADILHGGKGNDLLEGGGGGDTYIFELGDGIDTIHEYGSNGTAEDVLVFGPGIATTDLYAAQSGNNLILSHINGVDEIRIIDWYVSSNNKVERFEFDDGTFLLAGDIQLGQLGALTLTGTAGDDILVGGDAADTLYGLAGNDDLDGGAGADDMQGGQGDDTYHVDDASDLVTELSGEGNDTVISSVDFTLGANLENLSLVGSATAATGNSLDNFLSGNQANNLLTGGLGNDVLAGGDRDDSYFFALGDGSDTIQETTGNGSVADRLVFGAGILVGDMTAVQSGNDLVLVHSNGTDEVRILGWYSGANYQVDRIEFADGTVFLAGEIQPGPLGSVTLIGTSGDDNLVGGQWDDILYGLGGNDELDGGAGADDMQGGQGDDTYHVDDPGDLVTELSGEGNDTVVSSIDYILGVNVENLTLAGTALSAEGNDLDNVLLGNQEDNLLAGHQGNDVLVGGAGDDVYLFNQGDGSDIVDEQAGASSANDSLVFGAGIQSQDMGISRSGDDLVLVHSNGTDQVVISDWFASSDGQHQVDRIEFDDGTVLQSSVITQQFLTQTGGRQADTLIGTSGYGDTLVGDSGNDTLVGLGGDDVLDGGSNDDVITGGPGDDLMDGGKGDDTYVITRGDGGDTIQDYEKGNNTDQVTYDASVGHDQLWFSQSGNDLLVQIIGTGDQVLISDWYSGKDYQIEQFNSGDGFSLSNDDVDQLVQAMAGLTPPASGQLDLTPAQHSQLDPVLAASWQ